MKETNEFLMPEYYTRFSCKMGECRTACCVGWPISVSMTNYFRLLGLDCDKSLRDRLDVGLRVVEHPTQDRYAQFSPRYDGNCPLRMEDGRCAIHAQLGEEVLPDICRLYPRGIRVDQDRECSCTNSCEAVLELLAREKEPLRFVRKELTVDVPEVVHFPSLFETLGRGQEIRMAFIHVLQDRRFSLPERLVCLHDLVADIDNALNHRDADAVDAVMERVKSGDKTPAVKVVRRRESVLRGIEIVGEMLHMLDGRHDTIRDYGEAALDYYGEGDAVFDRYETARVHFDALFPDWECWFEHMLVNHIFFSRFPFQERPVSLQDEFGALCAVYAILRFIGLGWMADRTAEADFVDAAAAAFRLIDHTEFEPYAAVLLKKLGVTGAEALSDLLVL